MLTKMLKVCIMLSSPSIYVAQSLDHKLHVAYIKWDLVVYTRHVFEVVNVKRVHVEWNDCLPSVPSLVVGPLRPVSLLSGGVEKGAGATWSVRGDRTLLFPRLQLRAGRIPSSISPVMTWELGRELPVLVPFPLSVHSRENTSLLNCTLHSTVQH